MRRWLLWLAAGVALCALGLTGPLGAQDDVAVSYDQIERVLPGDVVPPAPDAFARDEEETRAAIAPPPANKRGIARVVASLGRKGPSDTLSALADDLRASGFPRLERHVFYHGWERVENLVTGAIVLRKCDQGTLVTLDPRRKTYRLDDPVAADRARLLQKAGQQRPGGGSLDLVRSVESPEGRTIEGVAANLYRSSETLVVSAATGNCRSASIAAQTQTYYAPFGAPVTRCARPAPDFPATSLAVVARDGCRPSVDAHTTGSNEPAAPLVLYRAMTLSEGRDRLILLTARGNIHSIVNPAALFEIPRGYVQAT